ncbi:Major facilitator superfamily domain, general substrate transporter [Penicillium expansum]|uniref:Major facilitator superfamily domain, general substrate transporter n=1 Tax=Penicillium expansum TaxID=27334 RepID=A0A0A2JW41_PENEN|nr:Major facilitator superfamily domain, general substrate transporter [Penicillium expansum]KGO56435.1 Major facilitator superfamily domain, general substrate transporter [Penicillium expansum]
MEHLNQHPDKYEPEVDYPIDSQSHESDDTIEEINSLELTRINTYRLQQKTTVGSTRGPTPRDRWLPMGANKDYPPLLPDSENYVVEFDGANDPLHPYNWSTPRRIMLVCILCYGTFAGSFTSAVFSAAIHGFSKEFNTSTEIGSLGVTLYVLGFAAGPTIWAPGSELIGRRWPLSLGLFGCAIFTIACAVAKDIQTVMICRFFAGLFSASPISVVPAVFADLFNNTQRGVVMSIFCMAVFIGPFSAPFVGGFIAMSPLGWRWTMYISAIMVFIGFLLVFVFLDETYAPVILVRKAATLRRQTRNWGIHAKQDEVEVDLTELLRNNFARPIIMLITEPILLLVSLYISFVYGLIYALLGAYPVVFQGVYGMSMGVGGLAFIGLIIGELLGGVYILLIQGSYKAKLAANGDKPIPEWRLPPAIIGAVSFAGGMFWFGWTGYTSSIHWMAPVASGLLTGVGIFLIFLQCFNYIVDCYPSLAASTIAANTILRSAIGCSFPLFSRQMMENLGVQWAGTLLGCLAIVMIPIPVLFKIKYTQGYMDVVINWDLNRWTSSDDRVRGGSSVSNLEPTAQGVLFHGNLDIETLGGAGFASQRTVGDEQRWDLSGYDGVELHIIPSDGNRYTFSLTDEISQRRPDGREQSALVWEYDFCTSETGREVRLSWKDLKPTYRGKPVEDARPLDLSRIKRVRIMIRSFFGAQQGDFSLNIQSIGVFRESYLDNPNVTKESIDGGDEQTEPKEARLKKSIAPLISRSYWHAINSTFD